MRSPVVTRWTLAVVTVVVFMVVSGTTTLAQEIWHYSMPRTWEWYSYSKSQNATCRISSETTSGLFKAWCLDREKCADYKEAYIQIRAASLDSSWRSQLPEDIFCDETLEITLDLAGSLGALMVWMRLVDPDDPTRVIPLQGSDWAGDWCLSEWSEGFFQFANVALAILPPNTKEVEGSFLLHVFAKGGDSSNDYGFGNTDQVVFRCWRE